MTKTLLFVLLISTSAFAQIKISIQPEIGVNSIWINKTKGRATGEERVLRIPSPLFGLWATAYVSGSTFVNLGVQYSSSGEKKTFNYGILNPVTQLPYRHSEMEDFSFTKVSVPISIGRSFVINKIALSPSFGAKAVFYTDGSYHHNIRVTQGDRILVSSMVAVDPFYKYTGEKLAQRRNADLFFNFEVRFWQNFSANIAYSTSMTPQSFKSEWRLFHNRPSALEKYTPRDLSFSFKYWISISKRKNQ
jgi:hypothetical protein